MDKINAVITGVGGYVPEDVLTNEDISKLVDTTDEWIMTRVGIKERRILKGEGLGTSYMGIRAVKQLLEKTNVNPEEIEVILTATTTPDHHFPTTSSIIAYHTGCKNAMTFDLQGACAGFLYASCSFGLGSSRFFYQYSVARSVAGNVFFGIECIYAAR